MEKAHFGMIGLGTMGRNFLLNIAEHGIAGDQFDPHFGPTPRGAEQSVEISASA